MNKLVLLILFAFSVLTTGVCPGQESSETLSSWQLWTMEM